MGFSNMYKDHYDLVRFLSRLEMEWNKNRQTLYYEENKRCIVKDAFYEFEVSSPDKDIFLNIKGKDGYIRKVMAKYNDVMNFYHICEMENRNICNIMPGTFYTSCRVTTINYVADEKELVTTGYYNRHDFFDSIYPTQVIYQDDKTTIVYWSDKTKTVVTCSDDDTFSKEAGFALAYMKRIMGHNNKTFFHKDLKNYVGNAIVKHKVKSVKVELSSERIENENR